MDKIIALELDLNLGDSQKDAEQYLEAQVKIREQIILLRAEQKKLNAQIKENAKDTSKSVAERQKAQKELLTNLAKNDVQLKSLSKEQRTLNKAFQDGNSIYKQSVKRLGEVKKEIKELLVAGKPVPKELNTEFKKLNTTVRDAEESVGEFFRNVGNYPDSFNQLGNLFGDSFGNAFNQIGELTGLGDAFDGVVGKFTKGNVVLAASLGAIVKLGSFIAETTLEFERLRQTVVQSTNAIGDEIDLVTVRAKSLDDVFGLDFNENVKAANVLAQRFGITYEEAFDKIEKGVLGGANANGDFLDIIGEYSAFFDEAGLSADQFITTISQQIKEGVFSDKGVDAIKEATIRLREFTPATEEALNKIGISSEKISKVINEDGIGGAIEFISGEMQKFGRDSAEVGTVLADVFGGAGEDAATDFIFSLDQIEGNLDDLINKTDAYTQRQIRQLEAQKDLNSELNTLSRQFEGVGQFLSTLGTEIQAFGVGVLNSIIFRFRALSETIENLLNLDFDAVTAAEIEQRDAEEAQQKRLEKLIEQKQKTFEEDQKITNLKTKNTENSIRTNEKELSSIAALNKRQKELQDQIQELVITGGDYSAKQQEYISVTEKITSATSELNRVLNETDFSKNASIKELESLIKNQEGLLGDAFTQEDINTFLGNLDQLNAQLDDKLEQRRKAFNEILGVGNEVAEIGSLSNDASLTGGEDIIAALDLQNRLEIESEQRKQDLLSEIQTNAQENRDRAEDIRRENELEKREAFLEEIAKIEEQKNEVIIQGTEALGEAIGLFFTGQQASFKDFLKQILVTSLDALEKVVLLQIAELTARQIATKGFAGIATSAILTGVIKGAFTGLKAIVQSFAEGGRIEDYPEADGLINVAPNAPRLKNGDNVLIYAKPKEAVITEDQQQALNELLGYNAMKAIGVKGFENEPNFIPSKSIPTPTPITYSRQNGVIQKIDKVSDRSIDYDKLGESFSKAINDNPIQLELVELKSKLDKLNKNINKRSKI